ncbi:PH domain-containing protein [Myroides sp. JBRI-B21084]|uniref:PH domain-containing protein n=1 Tax=Myroides sp. JBRI-B21084 TaxID=3119977 RepID=UPI0026E29A94|nr:PH domain-containing protein [Paenimyroides cloacae]WKW45581.1 PH domain-containing protein [Paenimyroides cloacae]
MNQNSNYHFNEPNRLDRKALFLVIATSILKVARAAWPILAIILVKGSDRNFYLIGVILLITGATFITKLIDYFYFTYQVIHDELIIKKGWLNKSTTVVSLDKIHEVNLNQKFVHKLIGLYVVNIDTAGSAKTEIEINGIDFKRALALKDKLTFKSVDFQDDNQIVENELATETLHEEPVKNITISILSLIKIGFTRNYFQTFGLLIAFSFQIIDQIQDFFYTDKSTNVYNDIFSSSYKSYLGLVGVIMFLAVILLVIVFNLLRTLITYYNYKIQLKKEHITVSYGLTDSHIVAVKANKVQLFLYQQNYFQKLMNLFEIKIKQVASSEDNKNKKGIVIPGANYLELKEIFNIIFTKSLIENQSFYKPHKRVILLKLMWLCIPSLVALISLYLLNIFTLAWVVLVLFTLISIMIYTSYKNEKFIYTDDFIILRKGFWDITTVNLPVYKIQNISISQSYFQEKNQTGSLNLQTAAGVITLMYYDFNLLQQITNDILYKIEKNKHSWM